MQPFSPKTRSKLHVLYLIQYFERKLLHFILNSYFIAQGCLSSLNYYYQQSSNKLLLFYFPYMPLRVNTQSQFSDDQSVLLPMFTLFPPNEIIKKDYAPDEAPIMKLITKEISRTKLQSFQMKIPVKKNNQFEEYASMFAKQDYLGKYYADYINDMVYFKFNNKQYNSFKVGDKKIRYFAGLFIERNHFTQINVKNYQNIMKSLPYLQSFDYNSNVLQSFSKNTKGCSFDPRFSSNYESANLFAVIRKQKFNYDLILQNDFNSKGNNQWFNFAVHFSEQGNYTFNIVNFTKSHSLYQKGMKISCFSFQKQHSRGLNYQNSKSGQGWFRTGNNIRYYKNNIQRQGLSTSESYYTLSFQYNCKIRSQTIMFAHSIPYTGLQLQKFFSKTIYKKIGQTMKMQKIYICDSISGLPINCYVISQKRIRNSIQSLTLNNMGSLLFNQGKSLSFGKIDRNPLSNQNNLEITNKKSIVFLGRQHSGQVQSSFVLQGITQFLMQPSQLDLIKKGFMFFIIPMINVDGVKYGNYRTNLNGVDLNRIWRNPKKQYHPEVYYTKKFLYEINKNCPISLVIDIHGHSKSLNSFFYGNPTKKQNASIQDPKIFPYLCSKRIKQIAYKQCTFSIRQQKKNSARVVISEMFPKALVYTFQNSFYGYIKNQINEKSDKENEQEQRKIVQYTGDSFRHLGKQIISTYLQYSRICQKNGGVKSKWIKQIQSICQQMQKSREIQTNSQDGSDSEAQNQLIHFQEDDDKNLQDEKVNLVKDRQKIKNKTAIFISKSTNGLRRVQKKKTMPLPKTICDENVRGFSQTNYKTLIKNQLIQKSLSNNIPNIKSPKDQAVLSIFKIQTNNTLLKQRNSLKNLVEYKKLRTLNKKIYKNESEFIEDKKQNKFINKKQIQPLQKNENKKNSQSNIQQVMKKCSSMKTFLKAMGITIQNKQS